MEHNGTETSTGLQVNDQQQIQEHKTWTEALNGGSVYTNAYLHQESMKTCRLIYQCLLSAFLVSDLISGDSCLDNAQHPAGSDGLHRAETVLSRLLWLHLL